LNGSQITSEPHKNVGATHKRGRLKSPRRATAVPRKKEVKHYSPGKKNS